MGYNNGVTQTRSAKCDPRFQGRWSVGLFKKSIWDTLIVIMKVDSMLSFLLIFIWQTSLWDKFSGKMEKKICFSGCCVLRSEIHETNFLRVLFQGWCYPGQYWQNMDYWIGTRSFLCQSFNLSRSLDLEPQKMFTHISQMVGLFKRVSEILI